MTSDSPWFQRDRHKDRRGFLIARNAITKAARAWFESKDFLEVDTPAMVVSPGNEAHLHAFATQLIHPDASVETRYLHTSPEFACKKLLAAGERRIFTLAHTFRNRERTPLHAPEFTMLEFYRAKAPYRALIDDTLSIIRLAAETTARPRFQWKGQWCEVRTPASWFTVQEAFQKFAGVDLLSTLDEKGAPSRDALAAVSPVSFAEGETWSDIFSRILVEKVEPNLGMKRLSVLYDYPICEAALARPSTKDPRVAERFEIYACGVELANGFGELTDATTQRQRFEQEMTIKQQRYGEQYPLDEDLLRALTIMPEASGVALGFDRLVMLATGATSVAQVMWVPSV